MKSLAPTHQPECIYWS